jgi:hypothetical protein
VIECLENIKEDKRKGVKNRKLIFAFPRKSIDETRLFSFLPTEIKTGLPFLIQADFLLTASRGEILKDKEWNKWILSEIVNFFVETFGELKTLYPLNFLKYLEKLPSPVPC